MTYASGYSPIRIYHNMDKITDVVARFREVGANYWKTMGFNRPSPSAEVGLICDISNITSSYVEIYNDMWQPIGVTDTAEFEFDLYFLGMEL